MDRHNDPLGYYAILGLPPGASDEQIRATYKRRAMDLHPDRNRGRDTTEQFQQLGAAYAVLSDRAARARYDSRIAQPPPPTPDIPDPVRCARCGKVSAQPRVVVLKTVKSFVLITLRKPVAGIFCSDCARKLAFKASATTWALGWWGVPWGPIHTLQALLTNMFGGDQPPLENARMLGYQAYYFYASGRPEIAQSVAKDALKYAHKIPRSTGKKGLQPAEREQLTQHLESLIKECGGAHLPPLKNTWALSPIRIVPQLGALAIAFSGVCFAVLNLPISPFFSSPEPPAASYSSDVDPNSSNATLQTTSVIEAPKVAAPAGKTGYLRPELSPNGRPWPVGAGYLAGEPQTNMAGRSELTIDNLQNDSDVFVKLVSLADKIARPARQVYIPAHTQFTIKSIQPGDFDVRYRDLTSGVLSQSAPIHLTETQTARGIEYNVVTLTLYKVHNGNMASHKLREDQF